MTSVILFDLHFISSLIFIHVIYDLCLTSILQIRKQSTPSATYLTRHMPRGSANTLWTQDVLMLNEFGLGEDQHV